MRRPYYIYVSVTAREGEITGAKIARGFTHSASRINSPSEERGGEIKFYRADFRSAQRKGNVHQASLFCSFQGDNIALSSATTASSAATLSLKTGTDQGSDQACFDSSFFRSFPDFPGVARPLIIRLP
jgi:hypothetical protein